jgi:4-nitrophenyl phosphatase
MNERWRNIRHLIIDMDGVLYRGNTLLPDTPAFWAWLTGHGMGYQLLTNNSTRTPEQYVAKLAGMGIQVPAERILTSAQATALYLRRLAPEGARVYIIGGAGLTEAVLGSTGAAGRPLFVLDKVHPDYVVVGMDSGLTYEKLKIACLAIRAGARFIGSNPDRTFPSEDGIIPGCGAILAALQACTDVTPTVIGKPEPAIFELAMARLGAQPQTTAVLGDRLDTDVLGGHNAGLATILVLTGVATREEVAASPVQPDWLVENLGELIAKWVDK